MPTACSCSRVRVCDESHLQIAHPSLTLVPALPISLAERFCDSAVCSKVLRAHPRPPARRFATRHQFPDRAEVRVSQLLLSAHHPRGLLWWPALCRGLRPLHRVARLLPSGYSRDGNGGGPCPGRASRASTV